MALYAGKVGKVAHAADTKAWQKAKALHKLYHEGHGRPGDDADSKVDDATPDDDEVEAWKAIDKNLVELLAAAAKDGLSELETAFATASRDAKKLCDDIDIKAHENKIQKSLSMYRYIYIYIYIYVCVNETLQKSQGLLDDLDNVTAEQVDKTCASGTVKLLHSKSKEMRSQSAALWHFHDFAAGAASDLVDGCLPADASVVCTLKAITKQFFVF